MASVFYYPARCALYDSRDVVVLFARFVIRSRVQCFWREWGGGVSCDWLSFAPDNVSCFSESGWR